MDDQYKVDAQIIVDYLSDGVTEDKLEKADTIFVFGHSSTKSPTHAVKLYKSGLAPIVVVTGYKGARGKPLEIPGYDNQADMFADVLLNAGIPESAIIREKLSTNTLENVQFGMKELETKGINAKKLILCAIPVHLRRARATFLKQFPEIETQGALYEYSEADWYNPYRLSRLLGEIDRLNQYAIKGDTAAVNIPLVVQQAYERLKLLVPTI